MMAFGCMLANIFVFQDSFVEKIFALSIFNLIFAGFVVGNWVFFKIFTTFNKDQNE
jgi:hypothetical protein